ncbi:uncharacterized protein cubi_02982 [Cryptosporidium ubiquitum]|uniref:LsmAD domain-containing protein n=1 Tax=Cryptosporidium ubiquitum TaxID=857276 RepID=A0A1J4MKQ3_9CRYT|nr:uncharacterized protein cubi_02982 [Cryptosporidium ubiquitum]OII74850.1 hypothetical protein cubi_02982 [Cryptosporidium ubiquitum]
MESNESNIKVLRSSHSKNSKVNVKNATTNKNFNPNHIKKYNKQFQRDNDKSNFETRNGSITERITNSKVFNTSSSEFAVLILFLIGNEVELKLVDCKVYRGIFHSISKREGSDEQFVCIRFCRRILDLFSNELSKPIEDYCMFPLSSVYRLSTTNMNGVPTRFDSVSGESKESKIYKINLFRTDNEISSNDIHSHERILKPWVSEDHHSDVIEDVLGNEPFDCWDQFEENRNRFGIEGTYDENLYTTPLDYNEITEEEKRKAEILATEIEKEQKEDSAIKFENEINDSVIENDEEMHFSSVYRNISDKSNSNKDVNKILKNESVNSLDQYETSDKHSKNSEEISNKDFLTKNRKSNFSFNPNAKEFLPRAISNYQKVCEDHLNNFSNTRTNESINYSYEHQSDDYHYSYKNEHYTLSNGNQHNYHDNQSNHNYRDLALVNSVQSKGTQFRDSLRNEVNGEKLVNQISYEYYLLNGQCVDEIDESRKGGHQCPEISCDASSSRAIYYYSAESGDIHSSSYYVSDYNTGKWSNYSIHNQYYIPNNNSEVYSHYCNYQGQGTYY